MSGFTGAFGTLSFAFGVAVAFLGLPSAYANTWPLVWGQVHGWGPDMLAWAPWVWTGVLVILLYSATRTLLWLGVALFGFVLALILRLFRTRR